MRFDELELMGIFTFFIQIPIGEILLRIENILNKRIGILEKIYKDNVFKRLCKTAKNIVLCNF